MFFLKNWILSSAKVCKSYSSRKMLKNEALVVKIGFDTAENEPPQIWGKMKTARCQPPVLKMSSTVSIRILRNQRISQLSD